MLRPPMVDRAVRLAENPIYANWDEASKYGLFQFIFVDAKSAKLEGADKVVHATEVGGLILIDDLTRTELV